MVSAGDSKEHGGTQPKWALRLVPLCAGIVFVAALVQHKFVLQVETPPKVFVIPIVVGSVFGYLLGRVLDLRAEVRRLASELQVHLDQKEKSLHLTQAKLVEAQKMSSLGEMSARVAHDFNNVLTAIMSGAMMAQDRTSDPEGVELLDDVISSIESGAALTRQVLAYGRNAARDTQEANLDEVVERTSKMLKLVIRNDQRLECELDGNGSKVPINPGQLQQVLMNLVVNARDALGDKGVIRIRTATKPSEQGPIAVIEVKDDGPGMSDELVSRITEPFFTTKGEGKGTGLGLSVVSEIVDGCGGSLHIDSTLGVGTTFRLDVPTIALS